VFASLADISGTGAVWADFAGTIGKVVDTSGTAINGAALKEAIRRGQIVTVHRGTDGTHPTLVVEKVEDPADAGSSLTLDALKDVTAPASTAAGMLLGTTAVGSWGPVANPTAGVWPGKARTSRPNGPDRLIEVWDGTSWITSHYDSGWRNCTDLIHPDLTPLEGLMLRRVGWTVYAQIGVAVPAGWTAGTAMATLPAGFALERVDLYLPMAYQSVGFNSVVFSNGKWGLYANAAGNYRSNFAWPTQQRFPTSLPGTEASPAE
jgi:hypothetical protein